MLTPHSAFGIPFLRSIHPDRVVVLECGEWPGIHDLAQRRQWFVEDFSLKLLQFCVGCVLPRDTECRFKVLEVLGEVRAGQVQVLAQLGGRGNDTVAAGVVHDAFADTSGALSQFGHHLAPSVDSLTAISGGCRVVVSAS
jgi:hypothetical protein